MASTVTTSPTKVPLSDRSTNNHLPTISAMESSKEAGDNEAELKAAAVQSMDYHRQVLKDRLDEEKLEEPGHYVSPSDGIMSPCTKKLSNLKGKKFKNAGKPQALFAKAIAKKSYDKMSTEDTPSGQSSEMEIDE